MKKQTKLLRVLLLLLSWAVTSFAIAQDVKITGKITDASDNSTLPGVTIVVKGTTTGTVTDLDGKYALTVNPGSTLVFSFVGYTTQEVVVGAQRTINIALQPAVTGLSEVVVIGYGQIKKGDATGAVAAINTKDFNKGAIASPQQLMVGKVAGVTVTTAGGAPGGDATIRIRGGSSLNASNDPLIVIDGVPVDNTSVSGVRSPLSMVNPNDIEKIDILKDASATAIFGSRASNGVIMITTKKGKAGEQMHVEYNGNLSYYTIPKMIDVLSADQFIALENEKFPNYTSMLGTATTDWQKEIYQNAFSTDHNVSVTGQYKTMPYRVSAGYMWQDGILKTDNMKRTTLGVSLNPTFMDDHLKVNLNGKYMFVHNRFADNGAINQALQFDPTKPVTADNEYGGYWAWLQDNGDPVDQATKNPVATLMLKDDEADALRFLGNAQFDYKFHFLPDLRANLNIGYDYSGSDGTVFVPKYATLNYNDGGIDRVYAQKKENTVLDFYLNYVKDVKSIASKFDLMGGYSWQHFYIWNDTYNNNVDHTDPSTVIDGNEYYLVSFFGRLNYSLLNRYLLTFTLRDDGSSRFAPDNRWGLFPSAAFGWKINEESFLKNVKQITQLKLRVGWGVTGQQDVNSYYPYLPSYTLGDQYSSYLLGNTYYYTYRPEEYDANIKWEETETRNIALDFGFFNDRITGSVEYYERYTTDLLNRIPVPAGTNLSNYVTTNIGDMETKGWEFSFVTRPVTKQNFSWEIGANLTMNQNKITKLTQTDDPTYLGILTGNIAGGVGNTIQVHSVGYPMNSYFVYHQVYDQDGVPIEGLYVDVNNDGLINDSDRYRFKSPYADYIIGVSTTVSYKKFDLSCSGRANIGNYVYDNVNSENGVYQRLYRSEGPYLSNIAASVFDVDFTAPQYLSDYFIKNASFFKMDYISLSYLVGNLYKNTANLRLSFTVNNAFTITKYKGIDPEIFSGIDNQVYPRPRVFVLGVNVLF
jgi:iron complex outermembrane receptor protein